MSHLFKVTWPMGGTKTQGQTEWSQISMLTTWWFCLLHTEENRPKSQTTASTQANQPHKCFCANYFIKATELGPITARVLLGQGCGIFTLVIINMKDWLCAQKVGGQAVLMCGALLTNYYTTSSCCIISMPFYMSPLISSPLRHACAWSPSMCQTQVCLFGHSFLRH